MRFQVIHGAARSPVVWWSALAVLCAILVAPLFVVDVPPLLDYPNHLGRIFVLASLPQDGVLARFYAPHWSVIPNLALDIVGPPLIHLLPVHVAGRLLIAASVLLPVLGTVAYHSALGGRWWSFGVGLIAYNNCQLYGFLNFEISIGLALLLAASWLRWRETRPAWAIVAALIGAPVLFTCHIMGLIFFAALIGSTELFRLYRALPASRVENILRAAAERGAILALVLFVPVMLYALSALEQLHGDALFGTADKVGHFLAVFVNYSLPLDLTTAAMAIWLPVLCLLLRRGTIPGPAGIAMALLTVTYVAAPYSWKGTSGLDMRFAVMMAFMLFAGFLPGGLPNWSRFAIAIALGAAFTARMALLTTVWATHATDLADLRTVLAPVQPGQTVYVTMAGLQEVLPYWRDNPGWRRLSNGVRTDTHLGALVLIEHRAFWQGEFDFPSQQPIVTLEPFNTLARRAAMPHERGEALAADLCGFDYVLLTEADALPRLPTDRFRLLDQAGFAALYAVTKCAAK
ncbi:MAG TPA: hypothetical protein DDZ81_17795 [Acetobacteraceae bacterium]|jgi:hypothetical protein|nr:hypothetical protein [Acetobacteraceae bacterium]